MENARDLLAGLEQQLKHLSHSQDAVELIRSFANRLGKTKHRQEVFNTTGALLRLPIVHGEVVERGLFPAEEDVFTVLQGDIVRTGAAHLLGRQVMESNGFVIARPTCDLVPGRRQYAALLRITSWYVHDANVANLVGNLLKFTSSQYMYLPPLPGDPADVVANSVEFDGVVQIQLEKLLLAERRASLSLVGWRILASMLRSVFTRAGENEVQMRVSLEQ